MSESIGYEREKCEVRISPKCEKKNAAYQRRPRFAQQGPWLDSCETCARVPYEQREQEQFQERSEQSKQEDPANGF